MQAVTFDMYCRPSNNEWADETLIKYLLFLSMIRISNVRRQQFGLSFVQQRFNKEANNDALYEHRQSVSHSVGRRNQSVSR